MSLRVKPVTALEMADELTLADQIPHNSEGIEILNNFAAQTFEWLRRPHGPLLRQPHAELLTQLAFLKGDPERNDYWEQTVKATIALGNAYRTLESVVAS